MGSDTRGPDPAVLIIEPMGAGLALADAAWKAGLHVAAASYDAGDRRLPDAYRDRVELLQVETNDEAAVSALALELHARRPLAGILPGFEFYVDTAARLSARLGLPGLPVETVPRLRDKALMRRAVEAAGLRVPRYAEATDERSLAAAGERVGFPAVLKPAASAGSVHVSRVDDAAQLAEAYAWMHADTRTDLGRRLDGRVLLEEYLDGPEVSVEGFVAGGSGGSGGIGGELRVLSVTTKLLGPEPWFVEVGHIVPHELDATARATVEAYVAAVARALGLSLGVFHCELRLVGGEPVLVELGARLPGGHIADLVELVTGVSLPTVMLAAHTGLDPARLGAFGTPRAKHAAIAAITATGSGPVTGITGLERLRAAPDVLDVQVYVSPGEQLPLPDDFRARLGHVIFAADSYSAALERWHAVRAEVRHA
jgi:biotin carboxylase